jgi:hypothetical protein
MIARLPDSSGELLAQSEGVAAFDELGCSLDGFGWREQYVDVLWHHGKPMKEKPGLVAVAEEGGEE